MTNHQDILSGDKGKKGSTSSPNTLRSKTRAGVILAIGEGPIKGLVNGAKSIFLNKTPLENADGSKNFENVFWQFHNGHPDDGHFNGFNSVATPVTVNDPVKKSLSGVIRTISEPLADAVKVIMRLDSLFVVNDKGAMRRTSVSYGIDVRSAGGAWARQLTHNIVDEKCTSPSQIEHRIELPIGGSPWDVRVVRITDDAPAGDDKIQNGTTWDSYLVLVEEKFTYPNTAAIAVEVNAEDIGSSMPEITVEIESREIKIPTNYDPVTRAYTGVWDGTFKVAYSNNPAWIYYDVVDNNIFGIGDLVDITAINKWALYAIGQTCDGQVKSGYKTPLGADIMEPRYTFNGVIRDKRSAFAALRAITTTWRGMSYWSHGQVFTTIDAPQDVARIFGPSNVVDGRFDYSETSVRARHSVVLVRWNDPNDHYAPATEVFVDDELLRLYGWREKSVTLEGCTSRSLARRYAKWIIDTEKYETESVSFTASWDNLNAVPGEIIEISDPRRAQVLMSGRIRTSTASNIYLDTDFVPAAGATYQVRIQMSDGTLQTRDVLQTYPLEPRRLRVQTISGTVMPDANYIVTGTDVKPRSYRILSVDETDNEMFSVTALQHDPNKYARVEQGITFEPVPYIRDQNIIGAPQGLSASDVTFNTPTGTSTEVYFSWAAPGVIPVRGYIVSVNTPSEGTIRLPETSSNTITYVAQEPGEYTFGVRAVSFSNVQSQPVYLVHTVEGLAQIGTGIVSDLVNAASGLGGTTTFVGRDVSIKWKSKFADSTAVGAVVSEDNTQLYSHNTIKVYSGATLLRSQRVTGEQFVYSYDMHRADASAASLASPARSLRIEVTVTDKLGRVSSPTQITLTNPTPAMLAPVVTSVGREVKVRWTTPADVDVAGVMVWIETVTGFDPYATTPKFDSTGSSFTFMATPTQTYYVRTAAYDLFGKTGLNISPSATIATGYDIGDTVAPAVPVGLALTSSIVSAEQARLVATWNASPEGDLLGYDVQIKQAGGSYVSFQTAANRHEWDVLPGVIYSVQVRAGDRNSNKSAFSAEVSHTAAKDTVPPATPAGIVASAGFNAIWLNWTASAEPDMAFYEIAEAEATFTTAAAVVSYTSLSATVSRSGLGDGVQRFFRVRAVDTSGNRSSWSAIVNATTTTLDLNTGAPPVPTGLAASSTLGGAAQAAITATWNAAAGAVSYELGVTASGGNEVTQYSGLTSLTFGSLPGVVFSLRVRSVGETGKKSAWSTAIPITAAADSVAPAVPVSFTAAGGFGTILLKWTSNTEADLDAYQVYESAAITAPVAGTAATYVSAANTLALTGLAEGLTRNYWVRAVDTSGNKSAWSAMVSATTASLGSTQSNSPAPTGLALATESAPQADGSFISLIRATWVASSNAVSYEVSVTRSGASEQILATGGLSVEFTAVAGQSHSVKVRSVNNVGAKSAWSGIVSITSASDAVAPATPTGLTATGGFESIWLKLNRNTEPDFNFYEVYESATTTAPLVGTAATFTTASENMARTNLTGAAKTRNYWVRAVDTSGNKSAWSAMVSATTTVIDTSITTAKLEGLLNATSFASDIKPVEVLAALPGAPHVKGRQVFLTTDDKLYRNTGTGWTKAVDGADIVANSITAGSIAAGAIGTDQLAARAVLASNIVVSDFNNVYPDFDMEDTGFYASSTGATFSFLGTTSVNTGRRVIGVVSDAIADQIVETSWFPIEPGVEYNVQAAAMLSTGTLDSGTATVRIETGSMGAGGVVTPLVSDVVATRTDSTSFARMTISLLAGASARRARFVMTRSAGGSADARFGGFKVMKKANGSLIVDGTLTANHVGTNEIIADTANIKNGIITNAKISDLSAAKLTANTALAGSITVSNRALSDINDDAALGAQNPATRINSGVTNIDPGKIVVSGATTLADWRGISDTTTINGGKIETDSVSARSIKVGLLQNLVQNGDFLDTSAPPSTNWTVIGGTLAWDTTNTYKGSASLRATKATAGSATPFYTPASKRIPVVPGEVFAISCVVKADAPAALGFYMRLNWFDAAGVAITQTYDPATENKPLTTDWVVFEAQRTAPPLAAFAEFRLTNNSNQTTALVLYVGQASMKRASGTIEISDGAITGAKLITTENVVTLGAQIKNAIITTAHIDTISAVKLTAATALAGTITVSSRALTDINTDAALGAQNPTTRINAGSTTIDPGKIVISGATTLANWRGSTDTTTINGGAIETDSISARTLKIGTLQNLVQNGDFSDTSVLPSSYWLSSAGSLVWDTTETYMGSASLRATKAASNSSHIFYSTVAKRIPVVAGESISLSAVVKANAAAAVGLYARLNWYDATGAAITPAFSGKTENKPLTTGWALHEWQVVVPALAAFAEVRFINHGNQTTATIVYIGRVSVQRVTGTVNIQDGAITGAKLITTENVITLGAQIKEAVITNAHIADLSAAKLTAGTALAGTITVSGRALSGISANDKLSDVMNTLWIRTAGTGTSQATTTAGDFATGTQALLANPDAEAHWRSGDFIVPDPAKLYKVTFRVRRVSGTLSSFYIGVEQFDAVGVSLGNLWLRSMAQSAVPTTFTEYTVYFKGTAVAAAKNGATVASPAVLIDSTRSIKPKVIFNQNYAAPGSTMILDSCTIEVVSEDAAEVVNAGVTQIDPGKIVISGATTLADWRNGTDSTTIEGGKIAANSISANKLEIGSRNLTVTNLRFEHNSPSANYVSWTSGAVRYVNDAGVTTFASISANATGVQWTSGVLFIYWVKGATALSTTTTQATAFGADNVILANYQGDTILVTDYGRTVIDGSNIKTGTVKAAQIDTTAAVITGTAQISNAVITTAKIGDAAVTNAKIGDLQVDTIKIAGNAVTVFRGARSTGAASSTVNSWTTIAEIGFAPTDGANSILALVGAGMTMTSGASEGGVMARGNVRLLWRGEVVREFIDVMTLVAGSNTITSPLAMTEILTAGSGNGVLTFQISKGATAGTFTVDASLIAGEFKR